MTHRATVLALHGAFRGGWYWAPLAERLAAHDVGVVAPDLVGDRLDDWIGCAVDAVEGIGADRVVVVGHSLGGIVAQALPAALSDRIVRTVLLDAPLVEPGQRPVDVSVPGVVDDAQLPGRDHRVPPTPVGAAQGFGEPTLAAWVNDHLVPVPMGPQLDHVPDGLGRPPGTRLVFFELTPASYPSSLARRRCEAEGLPHLVLPGQHHDAPVLDPAAIAALLVGPPDPVV